MCNLKQPETLTSTVLLFIWCLDYKHLFHFDTGTILLYLYIITNYIFSSDTREMKQGETEDYMQSKMYTKIIQMQKC